MQRPTMGDRRKIRGRCGVQVQVPVQAGIGAVEHWKSDSGQRAGSLNKICSRPPQSPLADGVSTATSLLMLLAVGVGVAESSPRPFRGDAAMICAHRRNREFPCPLQPSAACYQCGDGTRGKKEDSTRRCVRACVARVYDVAGNFLMQPMRWVVEKCPQPSFRVCRARARARAGGHWRLAPFNARLCCACRNERLAFGCWLLFAAGFFCLLRVRRRFGEPATWRWEIPRFLTRADSLLEGPE